MPTYIEQLARLTKFSEEVVLYINQSGDLIRSVYLWADTADVDLPRELKDDLKKLWYQQQSILKSMPLDEGD